MRSATKKSRFLSVYSGKTSKFEISVLLKQTPVKFSFEKVSV